jgi:transposase
VEVLAGTPRRRPWSAAGKAAIVAESLASGAVRSAIALRHGLHRNQLYAWRRELRASAVAAAGVPLPDFIPVGGGRSQAACGAAAIEIAIGGALVRVGSGVDPGLLGEVLRLIGATA